MGSQTLPALVATDAELEIGLIHTVWGNADPNAAWVEWADFEIRNLSIEPGESEEEYLWLHFEHIGDPSLTYVVEASDDLREGWYPLRTYGPFVLPGSQTYFDEHPVGAAERRFIRLAVHRSE
jgi:hypothetical protein